MSSYCFSQLVKREQIISNHEEDARIEIRTEQLIINLSGATSRAEAEKPENHPSIVDVPQEESVFSGAAFDVFNLLLTLGPEITVLDVTSSNPECIHSF